MVVKIWQSLLVDVLPRPALLRHFQGTGTRCGKHVFEAQLGQLNKSLDTRGRGRLLEPSQTPVVPRSMPASPRTASLKIADFATYSKYVCKGSAAGGRGSNQAHAATKLNELGTACHASGRGWRHYLEALVNRVGFETDYVFVEDGHKMHKTR